MPLTFFRSAWPPSLPSVPTSRATRVTSEVNAPICSIIALTIVAERRNSPRSGRPSTSSGTVCERSPLATALIARVTSVVGHSRSSMSMFIELSIAPHAPERRSTVMRWRVLPSLPTIWPARSTSRATRWLEAMISLKVSAILPPMPVRSLGRRTEKSPSRTACRARSSFFRSISVSDLATLAPLRRLPFLRPSAREARLRTRSCVSIERTPQLQLR